VVVEHQGNSRQSILAHAARLFREQGYAATTLRAVASKAGITAASVYYHFTSKDEIVIEILNRGVQAVHAEVRKEVDALGPAPGERALLRAAVTAHLRSLLELHDFTSANTRIFGQVDSAVREAALGARREYEAYWQDLLRKVTSADPAKISLLLLLLLGAMNGALEWYRPEGPQSVEDISEVWVSIIFDGVGAGHD
jgi:AcrR family transcriptional regulator